MEAAIFKNEAEGQYTHQSYERSQDQLQWFTQELSRMNLVSTIMAGSRLHHMLIYYLFRQRSSHQNIHEKH
jgi:hypothetical protein